MSLNWRDESGLLPDSVFAESSIPKNLIGVIGFCAGKLEAETPNSTLVSPELVSEAVQDCSNFMFSEELDKKISEMMADVNTVSGYFTSEFHILSCIGCPRLYQRPTSRDGLSQENSFKGHPRFQG